MDARTAQNGFHNRPVGSASIPNSVSGREAVAVRPASSGGESSPGQRGFIEARVIVTVMMIAAFICLAAAVALLPGCTSWQAPHDPKTERLTLYGRVFNSPVGYPIRLIDGIRQFDGGDGWDTTRPRVRLSNPDVPGATEKRKPNL